MMTTNFDTSNLASAHKIKEAVRVASTAALNYAPPAEELQEANLLCTTCGHSAFSHNLPNNRCMFCYPKGSTHAYDDSSGGGRISEAQSMSLIECFIRLQEAIYPHDEEVKPSSPSRTTADKAKRSRASLYNSHCLASYRATIAAYNSGSATDHTVAASHHELAASAAKNAQELHENRSTTFEDYKAAMTYHNSQAAAHKAAAASGERGNNTSKYDLPLSTY